MSFSIQTNVNSLIAQENLRVNSNFQGQTIQRLTSGYRINSSADDAAGLAIANKFRSDTAELSQGVRNANDGVSQLQIMDGGMNNVSKMLDRLKTLAAQTASDTFTGDRTLANDEFTGLLDEIDRQAKAVGLDQNGQFAKTLQVFVGGGRTHGLGQVDVDNGTVNVNLTSSAVDTKSLGLKGMQLVANKDVDIGGDNSPHNVKQILLAANNTTPVPDITTFYFSGAGFSDANKIKVQVNTESVLDIDTLASAFNKGIQDAAAENNAAAVNFKDAGIVVSVNTETSGKKSLAFTSTSAAFQVEAGDRMANAFLGNLDVNTADGKTLAGSTVNGALTSSDATGYDTSVTATKIRFTGGGLASAVDIALDSTGASNNTVGQTITNLKAAMEDASSDAGKALAAAGISMVAHNDQDALTFTNSRGEKFNVEITGDTANKLGYGAFVQGSINAVDYTSIDGATDAYTAGTDTGVETFQFSINGATSNAGTNKFSVNLSLGDATRANCVSGLLGAFDASTTTLTINGTDNILFAGAASADTTAKVVGLINAYADANSKTYHASMNAGGTRLTITSDTPGVRALTFGGAAAATLKLSGANGETNTAGASRSANDLRDAINAQIDQSDVLRAAGIRSSVAVNGANATLSFGSTTNTNFRVSMAGSAANIGFGTAGSDFATYTTQTSKASVMNSGASYSKALDFTAMANGSDVQTVTISANDASGNLKTQQITLQNNALSRSGRSVDEAINEINSVLQGNNSTVLKSIVAVKDVSSGVEKINFLSSDSSFKVGLSSTLNGSGIQKLDSESDIGSSTLNSGNIRIDTKASAQQAVVAIADAVKNLGSAQAAVGKGQNQLNYAIGLAQSQIANFSAAESRIRDSDVASEAANLTKASVLQQASIAAMAQANSAPQAVLSLLRG